MILIKEKVMENIYKEIIKIFAIGTVVCLSWQGLEYKMMGEIIHRSVDDVIAIILTISLYLNIYEVKKNTEDVE